jgi:hypothetical protein
MGASQRKRYALKRQLETFELLFGLLGGFETLSSRSRSLSVDHGVWWINSLVPQARFWITSETIESCLRIITSFIIHDLSWQATRGFGAFVRNGDLPGGSSLPRSRLRDRVVESLFRRITSGWPVTRPEMGSCLRLGRGSKEAGFRTERSKTALQTHFMGERFGTGSVALSCARRHKSPGSAGAIELA